MEPFQHEHSRQQPDPLGSIPESEQIASVPEELLQMAVSEARVRAELLVSGASVEELQCCDRKIALKLQSLLDRTGNNGPLLSLVLDEMEGAHSRRLRDEGRIRQREFREKLIEIESFAHDSSEELGRLLGMEAPQETLDEKRAEIDCQIDELQRTTHKELFQCYKTLPNKLASIRRLAEREGEENFLEAYDTAMRIERAISSRRFEELHESLNPFSRSERQFVAEVYEQVFQCSIKEAIDNRFYLPPLPEMPEGARFHTRMLHRAKTAGLASVQVVRGLSVALRLGSFIKRIVEDKYGLESGALEAAEEKLEQLEAGLSKRRPGFLKHLIGSTIVQPLKTGRRILQVVRERGKKSLPDELKEIYEDLVSREKKLVEELLEGDPIRAASDDIYAVLTRVENPVTQLIFSKLLGINGRKAEKVANILLSVSGEERERLEEDFQNRFGALLGVSNLQEAINTYVTGDFRSYLSAVYEGDEVKAFTALLHRSLTSDPRRRPELFRDLASKSDPFLQQVRDLYLQEYGTDLTPEGIRSSAKRMKRGAMLDWVALHFQPGRRLEAEAARLECALRGRSGEWVGEIFYDNSQAANEQIVQHYNRRNGGKDFWQEFTKRKGVERAQIMQSLVRNGELQDHEMLRHSLIGTSLLHVNIDGILGVLRGKSLDEQRQLAESYGRDFRVQTRNPLLHVRARLQAASLWFKARRRGEAPSHRRLVTRFTSKPRDLDHDLAAALSGEPYFDAALARRGRPETPEAQMELLRETVAFESESNWSRGRLFGHQLGKGGWLQKQWDWLRRDVERAQKFYEDEIEGAEFNERSADRFRVLSARAMRGLAQYREHRDKRADTWANIASLAPAIGIPIAATSTGLLALTTILSLDTFAAGAMTFAGSFATRYGIHHHYRGARGVGLHRAAREAWIGGADGLFVFMAPVFRGLRFGQLILNRKAQLAMRVLVDIIGKGQAKRYLRSFGVKAFERRYKEVVSGHHAKIRELEEERQKILKGKRLGIGIDDEFREMYRRAGRFERDGVPTLKESVSWYLSQGRRT